MAAGPGKSKPRTEAGIASAEKEPKASGTSRPPARPREPTPASERDRILEFIKGVHATQLLAFAQESGAFAHIRNYEPHGIGVKDLADHLGWNDEYTRFFVETAFALGFLELASEAGVTPRARYRFAPHMMSLLADDSHGLYVGDYPRYHALASQDSRRLPELFRSGKAFPYGLHGEDFLRSAAMVTRTLPNLFLDTYLAKLPELRKRLEEGAHLLDVGCGAGWAVVQLAERFSRSRILGIDAEPNAIEMAKTILTMRQLTQRAEVRLVRGEEIDYEAEFDVATFFLVLHAIPPTQKLVALRHAARALKRGGLLLIVDEAYPETLEEFRDPVHQLSVVTQWLEAPWGHRLSTPSDHRRMLSEAGLRVVRELADQRHYVVLAQKT